MTSSTIYWCTGCDKEVSKDHDCKGRDEIPKLSRLKYEHF